MTNSTKWHSNLAVTGMKNNNHITVHIKTDILFSHLNLMKQTVIIGKRKIKNYDYDSNSKILWVKFINC